jgi:hypothetical protein
LHQDLGLLKGLVERVSTPFLRIDVDEFLKRVKAGDELEQAVAVSAALGSIWTTKRSTTPSTSTNRADRSDQT